MDLVLFYVFGGISVVTSLLVIGQRQPMYSVLLLIASFVGLAGLYVLLDSPFAAVTQIIVYAGAIMVLFLFVVMLLNAPQEDVPSAEARRSLLSAGPRRIGVVFGLIFLIEIVWATLRVPGGGLPTADAGLADAVSSVRQIGIELFTTHAFAFEVTSVLILAAMVGAVALAKRNL